MPRPLALTTALSVVLVLALACQTTAPPAPAPQPVPVEARPAMEEKPAPPQIFVRVIGSRLNVRQGPGVDTAAIAKVAKGERLAVVGQDGDWLQVRVRDDKTGWVLGKYVSTEERCAADKPSAELLSDVPLSFHEGPAIGQVVIEATVDASGSVAATKIVQDTTGVPELRDRALAELKALKFSPPVRNCKPVPFLYTYKRAF